MINYWIVGCRRVVIDGDSNNLSLFDVIEQITIPAPAACVQLPVTIPMEMTTVGLWERDENDPDYEGAIVLIGPDGHEISRGEQALTFEGKSRLRTRTGFAGFPLTGPGRYFIVSMSRPAGTEQWAEQCRTPITIIYS